MLTRGAVFVLGVLLASGVGCAARDDRLWYKPGGNYTTAEFHRDRDSCTRDKRLDPECLKARGWVPVSPDRPASPAPQPPSPSRY